MGVGVTPISPESSNLAITEKGKSAHLFPTDLPAPPQIGDCLDELSQVLVTLTGLVQFHIGNGVLLRAETFAVCLPQKVLSRTRMKCLATPVGSTSTSSHERLF